MFRALVVVSCFVSGISAAQTETVGQLSFTAPQGWTQTGNDSQRSWERIDRNAGTFCRLTVSTPVPSTGSSEGDFRAEWQDWVAGRMQVQTPPRPTAGQTASRSAYIEGRADVVNQGAPYHYQLFVFTTAGQRQTVQLLAGKTAHVDACRTGPLAALFSSLRAGASAAVAEVPVKTVSAGAGSWRGEAPRGVYMAYASDAASALITVSEPQWLVLFDDGLARSIMPQEGLGTFDREQSLQRGDLGWGRWSWANGAGAVVGMSGPWKLSLKAMSSGLQVNSTQYLKLVSVDGLRLDGAWTSYANPEDPSLGTKGLRPIIRFTRDGRFTDEGLLHELARLVNETGPAPGGGVYSVKDFTLTLRYDSGEVVTRNFHGFLGADPAKNNGRLMFSRRMLMKTRY